jgi:hypothetical protein
LAALLTIVAGAAYYATKSAPAEQPAEQAAPVRDAQQDAPQPAQAAPQSTPPAQQPSAAMPKGSFVPEGQRPGKVTLPDGSTIEAINDVTEDIALMWDEQPYSPIVDKVFHNGWWWWKHQDGAWTTVKMIDMNGVPQATPILAREGKGPPAQTADEAIAEREKAQQQQQQGARR